MKRISLIALCLGVALSLVACSQNQDKVVDQSPNSTKTSSQAKNSENTKEELDKVEEETEKEDALNNGTEKERLNALLEKSDYISLVELSSTADNQMELRILTNFKGNLSNIEFQEPKNLSPNKQYLIFYHDSEDGAIIPTNGDASMLEVKDSEDPVLARVQAKYAKEEKDSEDKKTDSKNKKDTKDSKTEDTKTTDKEDA